MRKEQRTNLKDRRRAIIGALVELSRNGWRNAKATDYLPLEMELRAINARLHKRRRGAP